MRRMLLLFFLSCAVFAAYSQSKLAVTKVRNQHNYYFSEGKKILCKTYSVEDSVKITHTGYLDILSDSVIAVGLDTLAVKDIVAIKKHASPSTKIAISCVMSYLGIGPLVMAPIGIATAYWAMSQGLDSPTAFTIGLCVAYAGGIVLDYYFVANSTVFHSYNKLGTKYVLSVVK